MNSTSETSPDVLLDTDTFSEIFRAVDPVVIRRATAYARDRNAFLFTSVTVLEVLRGLHRKGASAQIQRAEAIFRRNREIVPDGSDYRLAAEIVGSLERRGTPIGVSDPLIAACALSRDLALATGNTRHFGFIQAAGYPLRLDDWREG